ncbi:uncharacterized protein LOC108668123, partial [Hyalella azteca]|uniref:Uncharacterized protein LOC108668123 n=1 Tax=Hyalella azteca TaxID=294128 RepID=A0A979FSW6_HYAAZ
STLPSPCDPERPHYTMTLVTTIGYGNIYPSTRMGRLFAVVFAMLGVPLTCILMAKNSNILSIKMLELYERLKKKYRRHSENGKILLYLVTWVYLSIGFIVFMFLPSLGFVYMQGWTYDESLYFTFITLATIGFGDLIAGYGPSGPHSDWYKIAIVVWIMFALGYWVLLLNFLQRAVKKKIVPKRIRVQFKTKQLAKQAEFLRQLMTKVREQAHEMLEDGHQAPKLTKESHTALSLMAETTGSFNHLTNASSLRTGIRCPSLTTARHPLGSSCPLLQHPQQQPQAYPLPSSCSSCCFFCPSTTSSLGTSDHLLPHSAESPSPHPGDSSAPQPEKVSDIEQNSDAQQIMSLVDLLNATVVLRSTKVPIIRSLIDCSNEVKLPSVPEQKQIPEGSSDRDQANLQGGKGNLLRRGSSQKEVTLPLKDVLGLVTIVANLEGHLGTNPSQLRQGENSLNSSVTSMVSMDARMPSLKECFAKMNVVDEDDEKPRRSSIPDKLANRFRQVAKNDMPSNLTRGRRGSCLDAFLDGQTRLEYVEVGEERKRCHSESRTGDIDLKTGPGVFTIGDTIISLEHDDETYYDEEEEEEDDGNNEKFDDDTELTDTETSKMLSDVEDFPQPEGSGKFRPCPDSQL